MLNSVLRGLIDGYSDAKRPKRRKLQYEGLDNSPVLFSSAYLNELYEGAKSKEEYDAILGHIYNHTANDVDSYAELEEKIIERYWRA
ncbi:hypothetical protein [Bacillus sp. 7894-2]|uniref:hypothetical protein n=1 Tax=Bacillus sp. 7894-2 TaxID=2021695 RepID=UPI000BA59A18|nr:hypothetical protein [Bacillus sp. 7894-2]PAE24087.1 hypothetical protein CHI10_14900 [Bacillus sp. 7894-2]